MRYERAFQIGDREMVRFHFGQSLREKLPGMLGLSVAGGLIIYLYLTRMGIAISVPQTALWMFFGFLLVFAILLLILYVPVVRHVRAGLRKLGTSSYEQAVTIDGFGVHVTAHGKEAKLPFDKIRLVRETKQDFYIYVTDTQAWLLPKDQMENQQEEGKTIRKLFTTVLESRRLKLRGD